MIFGDLVRKPDVLLEVDGRISVFLGGSYKTMPRGKAIALYTRLGATLGIGAGVAWDVSDEDTAAAVAAFWRAYSEASSGGRLFARTFQGVRAAIEADRARCHGLEPTP
ncbi:hypothetical protein RKE25_02480 [Dyella sp. BiH032]|uniref:hypothetical protein n=1 Tax=Dyella sp. BiH032 TaxID=3075430 RepID=UPI0028931B20|nr:hypothetical protein [Dyella sp. BiH032]WNL46522.1 hypothetical protein RKE25_02480 [Dyella sp. BiH032]